jgi:DNA-directed RNA polymerase specialized sigma24 family protein
MRLSEQMAAYLPQLRRFARLLCGSQSGGDAYVAAALEAVIDKPETLSSQHDVRTAFYRLLLALWDSVPVNQTPHRANGVRTGLPGERRIEALTPKPRQAFLLRTVEGFSVADTAAILGVSQDEVERHMETASREIATEVATSILIIEDEPLIAIDLQSIVEGLGHRVVGVARTDREAVAKAHATQPGLVLADIQLADGSSGMDAVNRILESVSVPVIFVTAYPERLLTGERPEPAYLINKPFHASVIQAVVSQALFFDQNARRRAS